MSALRGLITSIACGLVLGVIGLAVWQALPEQILRSPPPAAAIVPPAPMQFAARPLQPVPPPKQPEAQPPPKQVPSPPPRQAEAPPPATTNAAQLAWLRYAVAPP